MDEGLDEPTTFKSHVKSIVISVQHQHAGMSSLLWLEEKATCFVTKSWKMLISRS